MLKTLGVGVAWMAVGSLAAETAHEEAAKPDEAEKPKEAATPKEAAKPAPPQPFTLPPLPYAYDALAPTIDARTMQLHHTKHHQAYIDSANRALIQHSSWFKKTAAELLKGIGSAPEPLRPVIRNHVGGHVNHSLFWRLMSPKGRRTPGHDLGLAIDQSFGSFDSFKLRFVETGMKRFGSGWVWLAVSPKGQLELFSTANQDSPLMTGHSPVLAVDVWEHAYYLNYQERRLDYLTAFLGITNWAESDALYSEAVAQHVS